MNGRLHFYRALTILLSLSLGACGGSESSFAIQILPLDGKLDLMLEEYAGQITLRLRTQAAKYSSSMRIGANVTQPHDKAFDIVIDGIVNPGGIMHMDEVALRWETSLGALEGVHALTLRYRGESDHYTLTVSPTEISLKPKFTQFTVPLNDHWLRLLPDSVWFVASIYPGTALATSVPVSAESYEQTVEQFFQSIEKMRCKPQSVTRGKYANRAFIPPWPETWNGEGELVMFPVNDIGSILTWNPIVRYYECIEPFESVRDRVSAFYNPSIVISVWSWGAEGTTSRVE